MSELLEAIYDFRLHFPYKSELRNKRGNISERRETLGALASSLSKTAAAVNALPVAAKLVFLKGVGISIGRINSHLEKWSEVASTEYLKAVRESDRSANDAPGLLAFCVVRTLSQTLQAKIAMTRDLDTPGTRGGGGYSRLLRTTLKAAGAHPPDDLTPIMKAGKALWQEFSSGGGK